MNFIKRYKLMQRQIYGLCMVRDGLRVQLDIFHFWATRGDNSEMEQRGKILEKYAEYWLEEIQKAIDGKMPD